MAASEKMKNEDLCGKKGGRKIGENCRNLVIQFFAGGFTLPPPSLSLGGKMNLKGGRGWRAVENDQNAQYIPLLRYIFFGSSFVVAEFNKMTASQHRRLLALIPLGNK